MRIVRIIFGLTFLLLFAPALQAQKPVLTDEDVVTEMVT